MKRREREGKKKKEKILSTIPAEPRGFNVSSYLEWNFHSFILGNFLCSCSSSVVRERDDRDPDKGSYFYWLFKLLSIIFFIVFIDDMFQRCQ